MDTEHEISQKEAEAMLGRIFAAANILAKRQKSHRKRKKRAEKHEEENTLYRKAAKEAEEA